MRRLRTLLSLLHAVLLTATFASVGCEASRSTFARVAADSASLMVRGGRGGVEGHFDPELVRAGMPMLLINMEALHKVVPENDDHTVQLVRTYCQYIEGWLVEDGQDPQARARATRLAFHAHELGLELMRERHGKVEERLSGDLEGLRRYLKNRYRGELSAQVLFWTAKAWFLALELAESDDGELPGKLSTIEAMVARAVDIMPELYHGGAVGLLGQVRVRLAAVGGGSLDSARESFELALRVSDRKNASILFEFATDYAAAAGDERLRTALLQEVLAVEAAPEDLRLSNVLARGRAERALNGGEQN